MFRNETQYTGTLRHSETLWSGPSSLPGTMGQAGFDSSVPNYALSGPALTSACCYICVSDLSTSYTCIEHFTLFLVSLRYASRRQIVVARPDPDVVTKEHNIFIQRIRFQRSQTPFILALNCIALKLCICHTLDAPKMPALILVAAAIVCSSLMHLPDYATHLMSLILS